MNIFLRSLKSSKKDMFLNFIIFWGQICYFENLTMNRVFKTANR